MPPDEPLDIPDEDDETNPHLRQLRKKADRADELEPENDRLRKENVILSDRRLRDLDADKREGLMTLHKGAWEPDEIVGTAAKYGWYEPQEPSAQTPPDERAAHERVSAAGAGAEPAGKAVALEAEIAAARNPEEIYAILEREGKMAGERTRPPAW